MSNNVTNQINTLIAKFEDNQFTQNDLNAITNAQEGQKISLDDEGHLQILRPGAHKDNAFVRFIKGLFSKRYATEQKLIDRAEKLAVDANFCKKLLARVALAQGRIRQDAPAASGQRITNFNYSRLLTTHLNAAAGPNKLTAGHIQTGIKTALEMARNVVDMAVDKATNGQVRSACMLYKGKVFSPREFAEKYGKDAVNSTASQANPGAGQILAQHQDLATALNAFIIDSSDDMTAFLTREELAAMHNCLNKGTWAKYSDLLAKAVINFELMVGNEAQHRLESGQSPEKVADFIETAYKNLGRGQRADSFINNMLTLLSTPPNSANTAGAEPSQTVGTQPNSANTAGAEPSQPESTLPNSANTAETEPSQRVSTQPNSANTAETEPSETVSTQPNSANITETELSQPVTGDTEEQLPTYQDLVKALHNSLEGGGELSDRNVAMISRFCEHMPAKSDISTEDTIKLFMHSVADLSDGFTQLNANSQSFFEKADEFFSSVDSIVENIFNDSNVVDLLQVNLPDQKAMTYALYYQTLLEGQDGINNLYENSVSLDRIMRITSDLCRQLTVSDGFAHACSLVESRAGALYGAINTAALNSFGGFPKTDPEVTLNTLTAGERQLIKDQVVREYMKDEGVSEFINACKRGLTNEQITAFERAISGLPKALVISQGEDLMKLEFTRQDRQRIRDMPENAPMTFEAQSLLAKYIMDARDAVL